MIRHDTSPDTSNQAETMSRRRFMQLVGVAAAGGLLTLSACSETQSPPSTFEHTSNAERDRQTAMRKVALDVINYLTPQDVEDDRPASAVYTEVDNELYAAMDFDDNFRSRYSNDDKRPKAFVRFQISKNGDMHNQVSFGAERKRGESIMRVLLNATISDEMRQEVLDTVAANGVPDLELFHKVLTIEDMQFDLALLKGNTSDIAYEVGSKHGPQARDMTPTELKILVDKYLDFIDLDDR